jgi:hypothetical protein
MPAELADGLEAKAGIASGDDDDLPAEVGNVLRAKRGTAHGCGLKQGKFCNC